MMHFGKDITSRKVAVQLGNRWGLAVAANVVHGNRLSKKTARTLAQEHVEGRGADARSVPERWRPVFVAAFIKAALGQANRLIAEKTDGPGNRYPIMPDGSQCGPLSPDVEEVEIGAAP